MIAKDQIISTHQKNMERKSSHIKFTSAIATLGLLLSQSVYAADEAASGGIPMWVWAIAAVVIIGVGIVIARTLSKPKKIQLPPRKAPTPAPTPAPVVKVTKKVETPAPVKATTPSPVVAPVIAPAPVKTEPVVVKKEPLSEKIVELDALAEAKQFLAQQRFPQAVGVLNKGLIKNPARSDLMLELLAIYLKQSDQQAFDDQFEQLKKLDDPLALIQAEELHDQLVRPAVAEDTDLIEFDATQAKVVVPEPEAIKPEVPDYTTDSLTFTSEKPSVTHIEIPAVETQSLRENVDTTPAEPEFSLDDLDFNAPSPETKEATPTEVTPTEAEVPAKIETDVFDFSAFDDFTINAPSDDKALPQDAVPADLEQAAELKPAAEFDDLSTPTADGAALVDLEFDLGFDLEESFVIDDDKVETTAKKSDWATDLADENFTSPTESAIKDPFATEFAPEPVVPAPVKPIEPVKKDFASSLEEEFPFLKTVDTFQTRLELARNYIALGEIGNARELLSEVAKQGADQQQAEAKELIAKLAS